MRRVLIHSEKKSSENTGIFIESRLKVVSFMFQNLKTKETKKTQKSSKPLKINLCLLLTINQSLRSLRVENHETEKKIIFEFSLNKQKAAKMLLELYKNPI